MRIEQNKIIYATHTVVCDLPGASNDFINDYVNEMSTWLTPTGTVSMHEQELQDMNNDGTWRVIKH